MSIGHALLKEYVECVNCLYRKGDDFKKIEIIGENISREYNHYWHDEYSPLLSEFHPSVFILAEKLREVPHIKGAIQQQSYSQQNDNDIFASYWGEPSGQQAKKEDEAEKLTIDNVHLCKQGLEYYKNTNYPVIGLMYYKILQKVLTRKEDSKRRLYPRAS